MMVTKEIPADILNDARKVAMIVLNGQPLPDASDASVAKAEKLIVMAAEVIAKAILVERERLHKLLDNARDDFILIQKRIGSGEMARAKGTALQGERAACRELDKKLSAVATGVDP